MNHRTNQIGLPMSDCVKYLASVHCFSAEGLHFSALVYTAAPICQRRHNVLGSGTEHRL